MSAPETLNPEVSVGLMQNDAESRLQGLGVPEQRDGTDVYFVIEGQQTPDTPEVLDADAPLYEGGPNISEAYVEHAGYTMNYLARNVGSVSIAEDLTQTAFMRLWGRRGGLTNDSELRRYLSVIARNLANDHHRRIQREGYPLLGLNDDIRVSEKDKASNDLTPEEIVINRTFSPEVETAMSELSSDFLHVMIACDLEGLSYNECAAKMGIPRGTVGSRLNRAHEHMRKYLDRAKQAKQAA